MIYCLSDRHNIIIYPIRDDHVTGELHLETAFRMWLGGTVTTKVAKLFEGLSATMATKASIAYTYNSIV